MADTENSPSEKTPKNGVQIKTLLIMLTVLVIEGAAISAAFVIIVFCLGQTSLGPQHVALFLGVSGVLPQRLRRLVEYCFGFLLFDDLRPAKYDDCGAHAMLAKRHLWLKKLQLYTNWS